MRVVAASERPEAPVTRCPARIRAVPNVAPTRPAPTMPTVRDRASMACVAVGVDTADAAVARRPERTDALLVAMIQSSSLGYRSMASMYPDDGGDKALVKT